MLYIKNGTDVYLTRGDTARFTVDIINSVTNDAFDIQPKDTVRLTVRKTIFDSEICLQKEIKGSNNFYIQPSDTEKLMFGKYTYDVELTTEDGDVYTVIPPSLFEIMKEVTY